MTTVTTQQLNEILQQSLHATQQAQQNMLLHVPMQPPIHNIDTDGQALFNTASKKWPDFYDDEVKLKKEQSVKMDDPYRSKYLEYKIAYETLKKNAITKQELFTLVKAVANNLDIRCTTLNINDTKAVFLRQLSHFMWQNMKTNEAEPIDD